MTTIFVPTRFKERVACLPEVMHVASEETLGHCYTIPIWGYLMEVARDVDVRKLFGIRNCYDSFTTEEKTAVLFVAPLTHDEREALSEQMHIEIRETSKFAANSAVQTFLHMMKFLEPVALSQDCAVTLHVTNQSAFEPIYDGGLHIVLSSHPPGQANTQQLISLDNLLLSTIPGGAKCPGPAKGRGIGVKFDDDFIIGQIVGNTLYLFLPIDKKTQALFAHEQDNPFRVALACVWQEYILVKERTIFPEVCITSYGAFAAHAEEDSITNLLHEHMQMEIRDLQKLADRLRQDLTVVHTELRAKIEVAKAMEKEGLVVDLLPLWEELQNHPHIERITVSSDKILHYHTTPVYIEDEDGNLRDVGSFTIRISDFGVHIWSTRITHPKRVSHPHIASSENSICFGNVSTEVAKLCAENRRVEAVLLCLRWLTEGYEPSLTYNRIEEWPLVSVEAMQEVVHA